MARDLRFGFGPKYCVTRCVQCKVPTWNRGCETCRSIYCKDHYLCHCDGVLPACLLRDGRCSRMSPPLVAWVEPHWSIDGATCKTCDGRGTIDNSYWNSEVQYYEGGTDPCYLCGGTGEERVLVMTVHAGTQRPTGDIPLSCIGLAGDLLATTTLHLQRHDLDGLVRALIEKAGVPRLQIKLLLPDGTMLKDLRQLLSREQQ